MSTYDFRVTGSEKIQYRIERNRDIIQSIINSQLWRSTLSNMLLTEN
jgi:hypothetical protein